MRKHLKIFSAVLSILLVISLLSGCKKEENTELVKINLNEVVRSIFYAPMYAAINEGFFEEEGITIELTTGQGADSTSAKTQVQNRNPFILYKLKIRS